mmetsp:Transcript_23742/g.68331  ORF Transcript_23742/g.68331 Transcript_23742/m.68331 type:complete len:212 (+) Transcript_23742:407-1042(+)
MLELLTLHELDLRFGMREATCGIILEKLLHALAVFLALVFLRAFLLPLGVSAMAEQAVDAKLASNTRVQEEARPAVASGMAEGADRGQVLWRSAILLARCAHLAWLWVELAGRRVGVRPSHRRGRHFRCRPARAPSAGGGGARRPRPGRGARRGRPSGCRRVGRGLLLGGVACGRRDGAPLCITEALEAHEERVRLVTQAHTDRAHRPPLR